MSDSDLEFPRKRLASDDKVLPVRYDEKQYQYQFSQNWKDYKNNINDRLKTMWNFINFNDFKNEEFRKVYLEKEELTKKIVKLEKEIKLTKEDFFQLQRDYKNLDKRFERIHKQKRDLDNELHAIKFPNVNVKKRKLNLWYEREKRKKPNDYERIPFLKRDTFLKNIFSKISTIEDIINLKSNVNRFDFMHREKFKKLYYTIPVLEKLSNIIGMKEVKDQVFKMICYFVHGLNTKDELNHIVITGSPGVGKTTIAKILGEICLKLGHLQNDKFITAKRSQLIGKYCGHTAKKTQEIIDSAEGGVLFIDEVYSLGNERKSDSFTKECIDTINQNLTEKGDKFLCIIAGYEEEVESCFFAYNKGLARRFNIKFRVKDYSSEDLYNILMKFINENNWVAEDFDVKYIKDNRRLFKYQGGDMNTIFKFAKEFYSIRIMKKSISTIVDKKVLIKDDLIKAIDKLKEIRGDDSMPQYVKNMYL